MDDLITTLEVSTLVEFYVMFTLLCFVFKVTVGLQPSSGKKLIQVACKQVFPLM